MPALSNLGPEDDFPTREEPPRPTNEEHRANRLLRRWAALNDPKRKLVEQLIEELIGDQ